MATLQIADKPTLDAVKQDTTDILTALESGGSGDLETIVKETINSTIGTTTFMPLDEIIKNSSSFIVEYSVPGNYTLRVPDFASKIKITACAGGGGGAAGYFSLSTYRREGGSGGGCIKNAIYNIPQGIVGKFISITVGKGGIAGTPDGTGGSTNGKGGEGTSTIVGNFVTLTGGLGGEAIHTSSITLNGGSPNGGSGGSGSGGNSPYATGGSIGSSTYYTYPASGGGASLGNGGRGGTNSAGEDGVAGSGGGGGDRYGNSQSSTGYKGGKGGDGYVRIEWIF